MADTGSFFNFSDPQTMALLGALQGLGQASAPSRLPVTGGMVFGNLAGGLMQGAAAGQKYRAGDLQQIASGAGLQQALNMLGLQQASINQPLSTPDELLHNKFQQLQLSMPNPGAGQGQAPPAAPGALAGPAAATPPPASISPTMTDASGKPLTGSAWELANNNFGGMRIPGSSGGPSQGGFQSFATPEDGLGAISHQLDRYASGATTGQPLTTLRGIVSTWAPPSENDTGALLARAVKVTGFQPDQALNVGDPAVKAKLIEATVRNEQGGKLPVSPDLISAVAARGTQAPALTLGGAASAPGAQTAGAAGSPVGTPAGMPANAPGALAPQSAGAQPTINGIPLNPYMRQILTLRAFGMQPPQPLQDLAAANMMPPGPGRDLAMATAQKNAGIAMFKGGERPNAPLLRFNPAANSYDVITPEGYNQAVAAQAAAQAGGKAVYEPQPFVTEGGVPMVTNRTALASGAPLQTGLAPNVESQLKTQGEAATQFGNLLTPQNRAARAGMLTQPLAFGGLPPTPIGAAATGPVPTNMVAGGALPAINPQAVRAGMTAAGAPKQAPEPGTVLAVDPATKMPFSTAIPPVTAQPPLPTGTVPLTEAVKSWQGKVNEWTASVAPARQAEQRLTTIANAFQQIETGAFTQDKAAVAAALRAVGINVSAAVLTDPAAAETALHENYLQTMQRLKAATSRFTQQEFRITSENSEHPNLQPAANLQMLSEDIAMLRQSQALPADWMRAQTQGWQNPIAFESAWSRANPLDKAVDAVGREIGPLKGMPQVPLAGAPFGKAQSQAQTPQAAGSPPAMAIGPGGHKILFMNGQWVDALTKQPLAPPQMVH